MNQQNDSYAIFENEIICSTF